MIMSGKCKWACVQEPNTTFEPVWTINLILDDNTEAVARKAGLNVKTDADGDKVIVIKRKVTKKDGTPNDPPRVVDGVKQPFKELIGNGSHVNVKFQVFEWKRNNFTAWLEAVQVVNLVPYGETEDFDIVDNLEGDDIPF